MYSIDRTIDASAEPVTLAQVKAQCRLDTGDDSENALLTTYIAAARQMCEESTGRAFMQQTWRLSRPNFPSYQGHLDQPAILLPRPRLIGIVSVTYLDSAGVRQTLAPDAYTADFDSEPAALQRSPGTTWPAALSWPGSVQVTYTAGYGTAASAVPAAIQLAILLLVGHWYENREATVSPEAGTGPVSVPLGVADLLQPYTMDLFTLES